MRSLLFFTLVILSLSSCRSDKEPETDSEVPFTADVYPQRWEMVEMTGMMPNSRTTGEDMEYEESYFFKRDNTFVKTRKESGVTTEATGTFQRIVGDDGKEYYQLDYDADSDLIESCIGPRQENLAVDTGRTLRGTAQACDYPGKTYERRE